jgi:uncharacterized NAD-dependent epimerase/dehydratase family protein
VSDEGGAIAVVYCEGAYGTSNGKTAHGLVRFTRRYRVAAVIDSALAGRDAGEALDGRARGIPVCGSLEAALEAAESSAARATHLVVGLAPDGGRLDARAREDVKKAVERGLHVHCGLHDYLSEDRELADLAAARGVTLLDVRRPPPREALHFFTGKIEEVPSFRVALLGTDSAVGKRTTAWVLVETLERAGHRTELVGTGQTAWMQGARFGLVLDSIVNDFVSGEIEHAVWSAWKEGGAEVIVIEGQGSLLNPAYPGGFEILAAGRPDVVVLQHAPARKTYDGFPGYPLHPLDRQIEAVKAISACPVVAVTINHEGLAPEKVPAVRETIERSVGVPAFDVLLEGAEGLVEVLVPRLSARRPRAFRGGSP